MSVSANLHGLPVATRDKTDFLTAIFNGLDLIFYLFPKEVGKKCLNYVPDRTVAAREGDDLPDALTVGFGIVAGEKHIHAICHSEGSR